MVPRTALDLLERCRGAHDIADACGALKEALAPAGLKAVMARTYRRPLGPLDSAELYAAGGFVATIAPDGWIGSAAHRYICIEQNPLLDAVKERQARFVWSDYAPHGRRDFGRYWDAYGEAGLGDGIGVISYGPGRRTASLSLGFSEIRLPPRDILTIQFAGQLLLERLLMSTGATAHVRLTPRERDCLAFVAEGKSDWEIGVILGISQATTHSHVESAKRKLGARTRAQAVARLLAQELD